jgi:hypothetical protein
MSFWQGHDIEAKVIDQGELSHSSLTDSRH